MSFGEVIYRILASIVIIVLLGVMFKWSAEAIADFYKAFRDSKNGAKQSPEAEFGK
ncbi:MAG: hypothetical protein E7K47_08120 [Acidovorax sp.]|jgi:hypothetical protein|nr:hypothetical protein [Acidovorax sp.]